MRSAETQFRDVSSTHQCRTLTKSRWLVLRGDGSPATRFRRSTSGSLTLCVRTIINWLYQLGHRKVCFRHLSRFACICYVSTPQIGCALTMHAIKHNCRVFAFVIGRSAIFYGWMGGATIPTLRRFVQWGHTWMLMSRYRQIVPKKERKLNEY